MRILMLPMAPLLLAGALTACGGGGGSSDSSSGSGGAGDQVDATQVGTAAASLSGQLIARENNNANLAPGPVLTKTGVSAPSLQSTFGGLVGLTLSEVVVDEGLCGGTITSDYTITADDQNTYPLTVENEATFSDYCEPIDTTGNIVYNGTIYFDIDFPSENQGTSFWRFDLSYTSNHPSVVPSSGSWFEEVTCTFSEGVAFEFEGDECTESMIFSGEGDEEFRTENVMIEGNNSTGYDIDFDFVDEEGTRYTAQFNGITVCENGNIGSGSGVITQNDEEVIIDFLSCDSFVVTYNGESNTLSQ